MILMNRAPSWSKLSRHRRKCELIIDDSECCVCFMTYEEDIANQSGKDWVACTCGRWLHEDCAEDCILDSAGEERLCPLCLDILT